jgi:hypothetical protein
MNILPGTPPLSEREGWLLRVAELLERIADLEAENTALRKERNHLLRQVQLRLGATFTERRDG